MTYQSITDLLPELDALIEAGWSPCLNEDSPGKWHVGLCHVTVPPYVMILAGDSIRRNQDSHRYHVHAEQPTLREALLDALAQVRALTEPIQ